MYAYGLEQIRMSIEFMLHQLTLEGLYNDFPYTKASQDVVANSTQIRCNLAKVSHLYLDIIPMIIETL